ncbi:MAG: pyridoxamine 5'-phosphate oxidase family protein [Pseudonocardiaceae bacterium]
MDDSVHGRSARSLQSSRTALLTTFRRDAAPVGTPVSIAVTDGHAYFVTAADSGKARRLAHCTSVRLAPCTLGGAQIGAAVEGRARLVDDRRRRRALLRPTGPLFGSWLLYRMRGHSMRVYEVEFAGADGLP